MSTIQNIDSITSLQLQQMIFIYNAVMAGWTTKRLPNGNFRFKKRHRSQVERRSYMQDGFLQRFVQNMQRLDAAATSVTATAATTTTTIDETDSFELPFNVSPPPSL